jgi:NADPH-dependent 2,4-dienoyl-CoA reductase/sulfur reductase-like enzyme
VLERNPVFFSCPMSNKWLVDVVDTNFLTFSYLKVAQKYDYKFIQTEVTAFERDKKRVITAQGWIDYDYLIVGAGIRYNYEAWFGNDRKAAEYTKAHFPAAYIPNAEHFALKESIQNFKGGDLVMTLPPPPHRCPPSPYERACLIAGLFKERKIKGRIIILDPKDSPRPITGGFQEAFENLYKDQITYVPKAVIKEVDPFNKKIKTAVGDFSFDHSILMAPHQAGDMAWKAGVIGKNAEGKPTGWAGVDPFFLNMKDDPDVYVIGDCGRCRFAAVPFLSKSRPCCQRTRQDCRQIHQRTGQGPRTQVRVAGQPLLHDGQHCAARGCCRALPVPRQRQGHHHSGSG